MNQDEKLNSLVEKLIELDSSKWTKTSRSYEEAYPTISTMVGDITVYVSQEPIVIVYSPGMIGVKLGDNGEIEAKFEMVLKNKNESITLKERNENIHRVHSEIGPIGRLYCHLVLALKEESPDYRVCREDLLTELLEKLK